MTKSGRQFCVVDAKRKYSASAQHRRVQISHISLLNINTSPSDTNYVRCCTFDRLLVFRWRKAKQGGFFESGVVYMPPFIISRFTIACAIKDILIYFFRSTLIDWIGVNIKIVCADMQMSLCKD